MNDPRANLLACDHPMVVIKERDSDISFCTDNLSSGIASLHRMSQEELEKKWATDPNMFKKGKKRRYGY